jgi:hypothetical protein
MHWKRMYCVVFSNRKGVAELKEKVQTSKNIQFSLDTL